jgi:hypothetical protein
MKKPKLLNWLRNEQQEWETLLNQIGHARMGQPGVAGLWSMKDLVAHLTGWNRHLVGRLQAAQRGEPEPPPPWPADLQAEADINDWIYVASQGRSVDEIVEEARQVLRQLIAIIEDLPEDVRIEPEWHLVWLDDVRYPVGEFFDHFHDDHEQDIRAWLARVDANTASLNLLPWKTILWHQFGAALDMLANALRACPDDLWDARLWDTPDEGPEITQFWYLAYHCLFWVDLYLSGTVEGFAPPAPFNLDELDPAGLVPEKPFTQDELLIYLMHCREKARSTIEALTGETSLRYCRFPWGSLSFAELLLDNMRHVQEHAAQLNLLLGQKAGRASGWVAQSRNNTA